MKKALFILLLAAAVGCHKSESVEIDDTDRVAVSFSIAGVSAQVSATSRADATVTPVEVLLDEGATVRVLAFQRVGSAADITADTQVAAPYGEATYVVQPDGSLKPCNVKADGSVDAASSATPAAIRLRADKYDFYALTPALPISAAGGYKVSIAHGTDHAASCTEDEVIPAGVKSHPVTLKVLDRKCAKISFSFDRKPESKAVKSIKVDSVYLTAIAHSPSVATVLCAALDRGANDANYSFPKGEITYDDDDKKTAYDCSDVVLPKTEDKVGIGVEVRFNDAANTKQRSKLVVKTEDMPNMAFNPGYHYNFRITLQGNIIKLDLVVGPWNGIDWDDFDIGAGPGVSINVGQWETEGWDDFNMGGGSNANITVGGWTQNPDWADQIGGDPTLSGALTPAGWNDGNSSSGNVGSGTTGTTSPGDWTSGSSSSGNVGSGVTGSTSAGNWGNGYTDTDTSVGE